MKKRMKKLAILALTACMFASITACGSTEEAPKEEPVKEETVSVVSEVSTESVAENENEEVEADKEPEVETTEEQQEDVEAAVEAAKAVLETYQIRYEDKEEFKSILREVLEEKRGNELVEEAKAGSQSPNLVMRAMDIEKAIHLFNIENFDEFYEGLLSSDGIFYEN